MRATLVDVSRYQGVIDGKAIKDAGFCGIVARCTIGWAYRDPFYMNNLSEARKNDLIFGAYHVLYPKNEDPIREVGWFLSNMDKPDFIVDDIELKGVALANVLRQAEIQLRELKLRSGLVTVCYTGSWFWDQLPSPGSFENEFPLWEAEYIPVPDDQTHWQPHQAPQEPREPQKLGNGWDDWKMWQWTSSGEPVGVQSSNLDYNVFNGTEEQLRKFLKLDNNGEIYEHEVRVPKDAGDINLYIRKML